MSLMGSNSQKKLAVLLSKFVESEQSLENCRVKLYNQIDIDQYMLFSQIDEKCRGFFQSDDLLRFLASNSIKASPKEIQYIINAIDSDQDTRVTFDDFLEFVRPSSPTDELKKELIQQEKIQLRQQMSYLMPKSKQNQTGIDDGQYSEYRAQSFVFDKAVLGVDPEIEFFLVKLFFQMIQNFKAIESKKTNLISCSDFNIEQAFRIIDISNNEKLDPENIQEFLSKYKQKASEKDIQTLIKTYGNANEGFINFQKFKLMILPMIFDEKLESEKARLNRVDALSQQRSLIYDPKRQVNLAEEVAGKQDYLRVPDTRNNLKQSTMNIKSEVMSNKRSEQQINMDATKTSKKKQLSKGTLHNAQSRPFSSSPNKPINQINSLTNLQMEDDAEEFADNFPQPRNSAMKGNEEEFFVNKLHQLVLSDLHIEELKQELARQPDFNLLDSFHFMDLAGKGYITQQDLYVNLKQMRLSPSKDAVYLFFKQYDLDFSGRLEFSEFVKTFIPIEQKFRNSLNNRMATGRGFSGETKQCLKETIEAILENAQHVENIRQQLNRRPLFNSYDAFCAIDQDGNGFITIEDIRTLFLDYDIHFSPKEIYYIFRRFDKGLDGEVCYGEFFSEITPKSPYQVSEKQLNMIPPSLLKSKRLL